MTSMQPTGDSASDETGDRGTSDDSTVERELRITLPSATDGDLDELSQRLESGERIIIEEGAVSGGDVAGADIGSVEWAPAPGAVAEGDSGELGERVEGPPDV